MEKIKAVILIIIVLILTAVSAHSQRAINGKVIEILDGRTCVIEVTNTKIIAVLEFIETPEPEQPLHGAIKDHLAKLLLNQKVDFYPRLIDRDRAVGQILLDGRDISQQMLRDGAAWLAVSDKASIPPENRELYSSNEAQAKLEKRGIWGVENLKPAWEFRAEKENRRIEEERKRWQQSLRAASAGASVKNSIQTRPSLDTRSGYWFDVSGVADSEKPTYGGLLTGYDAAKKIGYVSTQSFFAELPDSDFLRRLESRFFYVWRGDKQQIDEALYAIAFLSVSKKQKFADSNALVVDADGQKINLGKAKRHLYNNNEEIAQELLVFKVTRAQLTKIAEAKRVEFSLGQYAGEIDDDTRDYLNNLLNSSN